MHVKPINLINHNNKPNNNDSNDPKISRGFIMDETPMTVTRRLTEPWR